METMHNLNSKTEMYQGKKPKESIYKNQPKKRVKFRRKSISIINQNISQNDKQKRQSV
jgi:hypothetical protein